MTATNQRGTNGAPPCPAHAPARRHYGTWPLGRLAWWGGQPHTVGYVLAVRRPHDNSRPSALQLVVLFITERSGAVFPSGAMLTAQMDCVGKE